MSFVEKVALFAITSLLVVSEAIGSSMYGVDSSTVNFAKRIAEEMAARYDHIDDQVVEALLAQERGPPTELLDFVYRHGQEALPVIEQIVTKAASESESEGDTDIQGMFSLYGKLEGVSPGRLLRLPRQVLRGELELRLPYNDDLSSFARMVGRLGSAEDVQLLLPHLAHTDFHVRSQVIEAIGKLGTDGDITRLEQALRNAPPLELQSYMYESPEEREETLPVLEDWEESIQEIAAEAKASMASRSSESGSDAHEEAAPSEPAEGSEVDAEGASANGAGDPTLIGSSEGAAVIPPPNNVMIDGEDELLSDHGTWPRASKRFDSWQRSRMLSDRGGVLDIP